MAVSAKTGSHLCGASGPLGDTVVEASHCCCGESGASGKGSGWSSKLGGAGSQGNAGVGRMLLAKLMESDRFCTCMCQASSGGEFNKGTIELCPPVLLSPERVPSIHASPALALKLINLISAICPKSFSSYCPCTGAWNSWVCSQTL